MPRCLCLLFAVMTMMRGFYAIPDSGVLRVGWTMLVIGFLFLQTWGGNILLFPSSFAHPTPGAPACTVHGQPAPGRLTSASARVHMPLVRKSGATPAYILLFATLPQNIFCAPFHISYDKIEAILLLSMHKIILSTRHHCPVPKTPCRF